MSRHAKQGTLGSDPRQAAPGVAAARTPLGDQGKSGSAGPAGGADPVLAMSGIVKSFGGARALDGVDFSVRPGTVHALLGMNGAGKSTLVQVMSGAVVPDEGTTMVGGSDLREHTPRAAQAAGVATVYQKRTLVPSLTVAENLLLGELPRRRGMVDWRQTLATASTMIGDLGVDLDPRVSVASLGMAQQTLVEIAREVHRGGRLLILDEPTASLGGGDAEMIHDLVRELGRRGTGVVYISHHLEEVLQISDEVTVLRDGRVVLTSATSDLELPTLVQAMVGDVVTNERSPRSHEPGEPVLQIQGFARPGRAGDPLDLTVRSGEVVAVVGPAGDVQEDLYPFLSGLERGPDATVRLEGREIRTDRVRDTIRAGLRCVTGDRLRFGLAPQLGVDENITALDPDASTPIVRWSTIRRRATAARDRFAVRTLHADPRVQDLSGGNQQKVLLGKWLQGDVLACLLEEPTAGVDVSAKAEIHTIVDGLASHGTAVLVASSDVDEVLRLADRLVVVRDGRTVADVPVAEMSHDQLTHLLLGGSS